MNMSRLWLCAVLALCGLNAVLLSAAEPVRKPLLKAGQYNPDHQSVEMFSAIKEGKIAVKLVAKDSTEGRLLVTNKTAAPLNVKMPDAFAGVQVLAQLGGGMGAMGGGGGAQGVGGGAGAAGGAAGGGGAGGGFFNVPAEKTSDLKVPCVCLEHGKPEPRPEMTYEVRPIETFNSNPMVREIVRLLGNGQLNQRVAQAATWHFANKMSWEALADKRVERLGGQPYPYFSLEEMQAAYALGQYVEKLVEDNKNSPADSLTKLPKL